jgi:hypothetical protein
MVVGVKGEGLSQFALEYFVAEFILLHLEHFRTLTFEIADRKLDFFID